MGMKYELDDLEKVFRTVYRFKAETWLIPTAVSHFELMPKALKMVKDFGKSETLLIVHYAGHGPMNPSQQALWCW